MIYLLTFSFLLGIFVSPYFFILSVVSIFLSSKKGINLLDEYTLTPVHEALKNDIQLAAFHYLKSQYLKSKEWKAKKRQVHLRDNYRCRVCHTFEHLNVHHIKYSSLTNEPLDHLVTLCETCHTHLHETSGYPKTYSDYLNWNQPIKASNETTSLSIKKWHQIGI